MSLCLLNTLTAQIDDFDQSHYALPPGPARISGQLVENDLVLPNTDIQVTYSINDNQYSRIFTSNDSGRFTLYINKGAENVVIEVIRDGGVVYREVRKDITYGRNYRGDIVIDK